MKYKKYLKSNHWKGIKSEIYAKGHRRCAVCGRDYGLNVHHITYERINNERFIDLMVLCSSCHKKYHEGIIPEKVIRFVSTHRRMFNQPVDTYKSKNRKPITNKQKIKVEAPKLTEKQLLKKYGTLMYYKMKKEGLIDE